MEARLLPLLLLPHVSGKGFGEAEDNQVSLSDFSSAINAKRKAPSTKQAHGGNAGFKTSRPGLQADVAKKGQQSRSKVEAENAELKAENDRLRAALAKVMSRGSYAPTHRLTL